MDILLQQYEGFSLWEITFSMLDTLVFFIYLVATLYLFIFALASIFKPKPQYPNAKKQFKYGVLFPLFENEKDIINTVTSFLQQEYSSSNYDIIVISNKTKQSINAQLLELPIKLLISDAPLRNRKDAIRFALSQLPEKTYDVAVILDSDSITDTQFLKKINNAYYSGNTAIQTHRIAKKLETDTALFGAVSEEINNAIFRQGHVNLGLSSALIGSGMAFNFDWLKSNINLTTHLDLEKHLETQLLKQNIYIEYLGDIDVYSEKENTVDEFYKRRLNWVSNQFKSMKQMLKQLPEAIVKGNIDYCNKLLQWIIPSRTILLCTMLLISIVVLLISWPQSLKWWGMLLLLTIAFSLSMPDYLVDARFIKALKTIPKVFLRTLINMIRKNTK